MIKPNVTVFAVALLVGLSTPVAVLAQVRPPFDSAQLAGVMANAMQVNKPMAANPPSPAFLAIGTWTGEVDEQTLRDELCRQSAKQMDYVAIPHGQCLAEFKILTKETAATRRDERTRVRGSSPASTKTAVTRWTTTKWRQLH